MNNTVNKITVFEFRQQFKHQASLTGNIPVSVSVRHSFH